MKRLGILGGMGPEAGIEFAKILIEKTPAKRDQEHLEFLLLNYPKVPDRTAFILGEGPDPVPVILEGIEILEKAGCTHIVIPCNTAHTFFDRIKEGTRVHLYNMLEETRKFIEEHLKEGEKAGLLATKGTVRSRVYTLYLGEDRLILPALSLQEKIHAAIYEKAKAGDMDGAAKDLEEAGEELIKQGAKAIILGCTEIEAALRKHSLPFPTIAPMAITAERILKDLYFQHSV